MSKPFNRGTFSLIKDAINTSNMLHIDRFVIDSHSLRGESTEWGTIMLLPFPDGTELDFGAIGIGRVSVLNSRLNLLGDDVVVTPEYKERDSGDRFVFRLELKKGRTKIDYKCTDPVQIRAPKAFRDPDAFSFTISNEDVELIIKAISAMGADKITFTSSDGAAVRYVISASEGDALNHELDTTLDKKTTTDTFAVSYKPKIIIPVLKEIRSVSKESDVEVTITNRGIFKAELNGIPSYVLPEV